MVSIVKRVFVRYDNGKCVERVMLEVDTAEELPAAEFIQGRRMGIGSAAIDVSTGHIYYLNSSGQWHKSGKTVVGGLPVSLKATCTLAPGAILADIETEEEN